MTHDADSRADADKTAPCDFEAELPLLLYQGELAREERERLKSHLATCPRCVEALAQLESTAIALDGAMAVPKPSAEQWAKLKTDVLARVAAPATAGESASPQTPADEACESIEEDLLVLGEVGFERKKQVNAHIDRCASCRETRSAFGSIGLVLNRQPLVWPSIERWDSLKETVFSTIDGEVKRTKESGRIEQPAAPIRRVSWGTFSRAAAGIVLLVGVTGALALLRGPSAEDVRRFYRDAQGSGTLAVVTRNYELVVQKGVDKPECRTEVDDALLQLQAIHQFERAMSQQTNDLKVVQLRDIMLRYPGARVTELALAKYEELMPRQPQEKVPPIINKSGFRELAGEQRFRVDPSFIQRYTDNLESQFVALKDVADEKVRKKRETDLRAALVAGHVQWAQSETSNKDVALLHYKKALSFAEPNSPVALDVQKYVEQLSR